MGTLTYDYGYDAPVLAHAKRIAQDEKSSHTPEKVARGVKNSHMPIQEAL